MIGKFINIICMSFAILLTLFSLNISMSRNDPNKFFTLIFICLGFLNAFLGINLLNADKKILSFSNFLLAGFIFILVGSKIVIYN